MEKSNYSAQEQQQDNPDQQQAASLPNDSVSRDTSLKGREEEVVNQQEQHRRTNADRENETNRGSQITGSSATQVSSQGQDKQVGSGSGQKSEKESNTEAERSYSHGQGNNDNDLDLGREDAEKTMRETPRM